MDYDSIYQTLLINCIVHVYNISSMEYLVGIYKEKLLENGVTKKDEKLIRKIKSNLNINQKMKDDLFSLIK